MLYNIVILNKFSFLNQRPAWLHERATLECITYCHNLIYWKGAIKSECPHLYGVYLSNVQTTENFDKDQKANYGCFWARVCTPIWHEFKLFNNIETYLKLAVDIPKRQQQEQEVDLHLYIKPLNNIIIVKDSQKWIFRRVHKQSGQILCVPVRMTKLQQSPASQQNWPIECWEWKEESHQLYRDQKTT